MLPQVANELFLGNLHKLYSFCFLLLGRPERTFHPQDGPCLMESCRHLFRAARDASKWLEGHMIARDVVHRRRWK